MFWCASPTFTAYQRTICWDVPTKEHEIIIEIGEIGMKKELPKVYEPQEAEGRIYRKWEESGCFKGRREIGRAHV